jgi:fluoride exporter
MKGIELVFLVIGAAVGAFLRYKITDTQLVFGGLSVSILLVNVVGSFILGAFSVISPVLNLDAKYTLFLSIGFCGSLTSMSSLALETCSLLDNSCFHFAVLNVLANVLLSLGALISGRVLAGILM